MWWIPFIAYTATAEPNRDLVRTNDVPRIRRYSRVYGLDGGTPVWVRYRNSRGNFEAATFRDGTVERLTIFEKRNIAEERRYNSSGNPITRVQFKEGTPSEVAVLGIEPVSINVSPWSKSSLYGVTGYFPDATVITDDLIEYEHEGFRMVVEWSEHQDILNDSHLQSFVEQCGCIVLDRSTTFVDDTLSVRYLFWTPDGETSFYGEAISTNYKNSTLNIVYHNQGVFNPDFPDLSSLAMGRAMTALLSLGLNR